MSLQPQILSVQKDADAVSLDLLVSKDLDYFRGHFPGLPLLPGVVQVDWALRFAQEYLDIPVDRFIALMDRLTSPGAPLAGWAVAVLGGPDERDAARALSESLPGRDIRDVTGEGLLATAALLERANLFVGNDSGLMHMAAAMDCPVVALFGPTDERLYGPWTPNRRLVRAEAEVVTFGSTSRTVSETQTQMLGITVDQALEAVLDLVATLPDRGSRAI